MLPWAADENKYKDLKPDNMQEVRNLVTLSPTWDVSIQSLPSEFGESFERGRRKKVIAS